MQPPLRLCFCNPTHTFTTSTATLVCSHFCSYNFLDYRLNVLVFPDSCCGVDHRLTDRWTDWLDRRAEWILGRPNSNSQSGSSVSPSVIFFLSAVSELIHRNINTLLGEENHWATFHCIFMVISPHVKLQSQWANLALGSEMMKENTVA